MSKIATMKVGDATVFVSVSDDVSVQHQAGALDPQIGPAGNSLNIGFFDPLVELKRSISAIASEMRDAMLAVQPDEATLDLSFSLKGDVQLIPVLVKSSGEGEIKVSFKWTTENKMPRTS